MAVYKPKRKSEASRFYVCEFIIQGKRIQESTGTSSRTVAKEYEKRRRTELERAAAGMPTEQRANRIRTVEEVVTPYLEGYELNHRAKSVLFAKGRLRHVNRGDRSGTGDSRHWSAGVGLRSAAGDPGRRGHPA